MTALFRHALVPEPRWKTAGRASSSPCVARKAMDDSPARFADGANRLVEGDKVVLGDKGHGLPKGTSS